MLPHLALWLVGSLKQANQSVERGNVSISLNVNHTRPKLYSLLLQSETQLAMRGDVQTDECVVL